MQGTSGTFNLQAAGSIFVTETSGPLTVDNVTSTGGNVTLTVTDTAASGENLVLASGAIVRSLAANGTVTLQAGDNIAMAASSTISAGQSVSLVGDYGDQDPAAGADFDLEGVIAAAAIAVTGGAGTDRIALRRVQSGSTLTINSGIGADLVYLGSTATPSGATGGLLSGIQGQVVLQGGNADTVVLDDSGDSVAQTATLTTSQITGMGMGAGASVQFGSMASLQLQLGSGADNLSITGAASNVDIDMGGGNDQVRLAGTDDTLAGFASQLSISGGQGNDSLSVVDTADTVARTVTVTATGILGLTPGNASGGFFYDGLEQVGLSLGTAADTVTVSGTSAATTISGGGGADAFSVGSDLTAIVGALALTGDGADSLTVSSAQSADVTLSASAGQSGIAAVGMAGGIGFSGMQSLTLALSGAADTLTVSGSSTALIVQANGGNDAITVLGLQAAATFNLGGGADTLTIAATDAAVGVTGDAGDTLVIDQSSRTAAIAAGSITGSGSSGLVQGLTTGAISFSGRRRRGRHAGQRQRQPDPERVLLVDRAANRRRCRQRTISWLLPSDPRRP